jgi:hypothetical protein
MNLHRLLRQREAEGRPIRIGVIGCGKFAAMFLAQVPATPGLRVAAIADLAPDRARTRLRDIGWREEQIAATSITDDAAEILTAPAIEVIVEATGDALAGVGHALTAIAARKHLVMVNVEADVLCGVALARRAAAAGLGLQPRLWRPAGTDRRAGRLGARLRPRGDRRRQGHQIPAGLPSLDARHGLGPLRPHVRARCGWRHEPQDVQLLSRRHQVGDRDGRGR